MYDNLMVLLVKVACNFRNTRLALDKMCELNKFEGTDDVLKKFIEIETACDELKERSQPLEDTVNDYINAMRLSKSLIDNEVLDPNIIDQYGMSDSEATQMERSRNMRRVKER